MLILLCQGSALCGPLSRSQMIATLTPSHYWNLLSGSLVAVHSIQPTDCCYHNVPGPSVSLLCIDTTCRLHGHSAHPSPAAAPPQHTDKKRRHGLTLHPWKIKEMTNTVKDHLGYCGQRHQGSRCSHHLLTHHLRLAKELAHYHWDLVLQHLRIFHLLFAQGLTAFPCCVTVVSLRVKHEDTRFCRSKSPIKSYKFSTALPQFQDKPPQAAPYSPLWKQPGIDLSCRITNNHKL